MSTMTKEWTVLSMLEWGTEYFEKRSIPNPRLSIEWLLAETLDVKRLDLYLQFDRPLSPEELNDIRPLVKRRATHEPLQYIIGYTDFMDARIYVNTDVLIPRIETEQLVEHILERHPSDEPCTLIDIGTGSGCIPIALKMNRPDWKVEGVDISEEALQLAQKNAKLNEVEIQFEKGNILHWEKMEGDRHYDLIISNPPYVLPEEKSSLEAQVTEYEPDLALYCDDPREMYGKIMEFSADHMKKGGWLYLEIHDEQSQFIHDLFEQKNWSVSIENDYQQNPRFVFAEKRF